MSDKKHTSAPWLIGEDGYSVYALDAVPGRYRDGEPLQGNRFYCAIQKYRVLASAEETAANVRLIAACPDMYEAITEFLEWGAMTSSDRQIFVNKFQAAIAKARSEEQSQ
jgi:hypothetical protein